MTTQPDPAAVRCLMVIEGRDPQEFPLDQCDFESANEIARECALPEGRALAEAVEDLALSLRIWGQLTRSERNDLARDCQAAATLARAYLDKLDGVIQQDAARRVGDSPSSDAKARDRESP